MNLKKKILQDLIEFDKANIRDWGKRLNLKKKKKIGVLVVQEIFLRKNCLFLEIL